MKIVSFIAAIFLVAACGGGIDGSWSAEVTKANKDGCIIVTNSRYNELNGVYCKADLQPADQ